MKPSRILLVEDDEITTDLIRDALETQGYVIVAVADGGTARGLLAGPDAFDCILLDRGLPDGDGIALLHEIRAMPGRADTPIVVETAHSDIDAIRDGIAAGAQYYLTKPLQRELLQAVVDAAVQDAARIAELRTGLQQATHALELLRRAEFRFRTIAEAAELAGALARLCPNPEAAVLTLQELLINGIEHGNLGIRYAEKTQLMLDGHWHDEIERRLADPVLGQRWAEVGVERADAATVVTITDQGAGFDWRPYLEFSPERAFDPNGRGIAMARMSGGAKVEYHGTGNRVTVRWSA